jgi:hypothetical protein
MIVSVDSLDSLDVCNYSIPGRNLSHPTLTSVCCCYLGDLAVVQPVYKLHPPKLERFWHYYYEKREDSALS